MKLSTVGLVIVAATAVGFCQTPEGSAVEHRLKARLMSPEVGSLPLFARDRLLLRTEAEYAKLPPEEAFALLREVESARSAAQGLKPLKYLVWHNSCQECGHFYEGGKQYLTMAYGPLNLAISVGRFEKFVDAHVIADLAQDSTVRVDVLPDNVSLVTLEPKVVPCKPAKLQNVAKAVQHGAGWKAALVAGLGGMANRTSTVNEQGTVSGTYSGSGGFGTYDGSYRGAATVTEPDYAARERAQQRAYEIRASANARSEAVVRTALTGTTVVPGRGARGFVYFEPDRKQKSVLLQVIVGTVSFEFPLEW